MTQSIRDAAQALLNCPHCGGEALIVPAKFDGATGVWFRAWCKECGASQMPRYAEPGFAAAAWNRRAALSAPQATADERVAEHMRLVMNATNASFDCGAYDIDLSLADIELEKRQLTYDGFNKSYHAARYAVEQSVRTLLSASQEDAEHAAMYRWLRDGNHDVEGLVHLAGSELDAEIRFAMKETK